MRKTFMTFTIIAMVISLFLITVAAHSGRTDSRGGHYNRSTGEYHYHHGYSAHQHYDMDGDGDVDCPYKFNDKSNRNNNDSSKSVTSSNKTDNSASTTENTKEKVKNKITFDEVKTAVLLIVPLSLATVCMLYVVLGLIGITIVCLVEKLFKVKIKESVQNRILHILVIIGTAIIVPLAILFILGIL